MFPRCFLILLLFWSSCVIDLGRNGGGLTDLRKNEPRRDEERISASVHIGVGVLQIEPGDPTQAYELNLEYNREAFNPRLEWRSENRQGRLDLSLAGVGRSVRRISRTRLNLRLNPEIPLRLEARTGVGGSHIDLSGMSVESVNLQSGVGENDLTMLTPNRTVCDRLDIESGVGALEITGLGNFSFNRFHFKGGVGGSVLDFSGQWARVGEVEIEVGVGGTSIRLPRDLGVEMQVAKSLLSGIDMEGFQKREGRYVSDNFERSAKKVRLQIKSGIGGIKVQWI
ncbi:MAG: hypothetical protein HY645_10660 [Acidobacteria bacterium]|nr:hypothetical protein [Acidobacteriota bacterium]